MITVEPVIETSAAEGFTAWPVSTHLGSQFLVLSGELTSAEVGTVMAVIAVYNRIASSGRDDGVPSPAGLIQRIIRAGSLIAPGGLRARDTAAGLTVNPSCCCGLEGWQEWNQIGPSQSPWLGHTPTPWVEHLGDRIRVWPDGGDEAVPPGRDLTHRDPGQRPSKPHRGRS